MEKRELILEKRELILEKRSVERIQYFKNNGKLQFFHKTVPVLRSN
jgi:hypothetical protein